MTFFLSLWFGWDNRCNVYHVLWFRICIPLVYRSNTSKCLDIARFTEFPDCSPRILFEISSILFPSLSHQHQVIPMFAPQSCDMIGWRFVVLEGWQGTPDSLRIFRFRTPLNGQFLQLFFFFFKRRFWMCWESTRKKRQFFGIYLYSMYCVHRLNKLCFSERKINLICCINKIYVFFCPFICITNLMKIFEF